MTLNDILNTRAPVGSIGNKCTVGSDQLYRQTDSYYSIQQTEQLYRQLVVHNTADRGSGVPNVAALTDKSGGGCFYYFYKDIPVPSLLITTISK